MATPSVKTKLSGHQELQEWVEKGHLYALVDPYFQLPDASSGPRLNIRDTDPVFYEMIAWERVAYDPPYLIKVNKKTLDWILNTLSTERWGLFLVSTQEIESLARHFQKFVIAKGPDQNPYFLRFHDPSVLEVLLQEWSPQQKSVFFGGVQAIGMPSLDTMDVTMYHNLDIRPLHVAPKPEDCLIHLSLEHLQLCAQAVDRDLSKVIAWHLRNHHGKAVQHIPQATLESRVTVAVHKARRYQLMLMSDLAGFVALMFELSPNFDEHPSFHRVLVDPSIPPEGKMRVLAQVITDQEWHEAQQLYDKQFWLTALPSRR